MTSTPGKPSPGGPSAEPLRRLRASDADRASTVARLQEAVGRGLLSMDEGDERIAAAFSSRYVDQLQGLFHDLPAPVPAGPPVPGWRALGEGLVTQVRYELQTTAAGGIRSRRFLTTAVAAIILIALMVAMIGAVVHGIADPGMHNHFGDGGFDGGR